MTVKVLQGHVLDVLAEMPEKSVHVCVTSPPYFGLRAYGTPPQVWETGNECACKGEHEWGEPLVEHKRGKDAGPSAQVRNTVKRVCPPETQQGAFCRRCGAWRGELGSEPTIDLFVAHLVEVFEGVKRVLRDDGTLWVNLGDSYAGGGGGNYGEGKSIVGREGVHHTNVKNRDGFLTANGLKAGDLCMVPARFALAMQARGWTLRSQIVLPKTAPMPESVSSARWERCRVRVSERPASRDAVLAGRAPDSEAIHFDHRTPQGSEWADCPGCSKCDANGGLVQRWGSWRPTSAYEVLYLFSKAGQRYYADGEAVRVPVSAATLADGRTARGQRGTKGEYGAVDGNAGYNPAGRNLWNYVMWSPEPLQAAHYAAYPRWLPRLAIQAGTSERGCCPACGAPWLRVVERDARPEARRYGPGEGAYDRKRPLGRSYRDWMTEHPDQTTGWRQSCACPPHQPVPCTALDPFSGSGTTVIEANALGRHGVGIELQPKYVEISHKRLSGQPLSLFAHEAAG